MLFLTWMRIFISIVAGGGAPGKVGGIARGGTTPGGFIIKVCHLFTSGYPQNGGMIIGSVAGGGMNGTTNPYLTGKSKKTGAPGRRTNIGRSKIPGASPLWNGARNHGHNPARRQSRIALGNCNSSDHSSSLTRKLRHSYPGKCSNRGNSRNPMRQLSHNDPGKTSLSVQNPDRENLKEGREKKMIGSKMMARQRKEKS
jgi:hypothetical protein